MPSRKTTKRSEGEIPIRALYGPPIRDAMKRGNATEMKKLAAQARKHLKDVKAALAVLDKKIAGS